MRVESAGHAVFAALLIGLGIQGLFEREFTALWQPVPVGVPGRAALVCACALVSLLSGAGLLWRRTRAFAAGGLLLSLVIWLIAWRVRGLFVASLLESSWSFADTLVMTAAAWVLFARFAADADDLRFATGDRGLRTAHVLYGIGLIPFGYAHFANVAGTAALVPAWLPWHVGWAYLTGATFIVAGVAIVVGVRARLAAALSALQMGLFGLMVWLPIVAAGSTNAFQRMEFATTLALATAGWVVADSYRGPRRI